MQTPEDRFTTVQAQTTPYPIGLTVDRAEGSWIWDSSGKRYLDMIAGVAVTQIGHRHPRVVQAIRGQVDRHLHTMVYGEHIQEAPLQLAEKLALVLPPSLSCSYFVNSGTEANEAALKLAKRQTSRTELVAFRGAYHGSTHGSLSVSGNEVKKQAFRPLLPDVRFLEFNNLDDLESITERTAGVIVEVVQGDAGVRIAQQDWLQALRDRCTDTGARLIFDEIQSGIGRTGKLFAFEHYGVIPDILTLGKGLGGGMPIGALISSQEALRQFTFNPMLGHITTFGGHPVCCAAASASLDVLTQEIDWDEVERKGAYLEQRLQHAIVQEIRRKGLMFAVDLDHFDRVKSVVDRCFEQGVLTFWFLSTDHAFRLRHR